MKDSLLVIAVLAIIAVLIVILFTCFETIQNLEDWIALNTGGGIRSYGYFKPQWTVVDTDGTELELRVDGKSLFGRDPLGIYQGGRWIRLV